jgi:hypothetical protein
MTKTNRTVFRRRRTNFVTTAPTLAIVPEWPAGATQAPLRLRRVDRRSAKTWGQRGEAAGTTAEGVLTVNGAGRWVEGTQTVNVADGRLTVASAAGASGNKICFVEISASS